MNIKTIILGISAFLAISPILYAQGPGKPIGGIPVDSWEVSIREMPPATKEEIKESMDKLKERSLNDVTQAVGMVLLSGAVDLVVAETYNLLQYNKRRKQEWKKMIMNENNYSDSITSIKGLTDFYSQNSSLGPLDPSNLNFDGIEIRGTRNGHEVIFMSCSIDTSNISHIIHHSKFNLVLDTLSFYPYHCHLPNVTANGIRMIEDAKKKGAKVDTLTRPGTGGNGFSFDERNNLKIGIDFTLNSSWINEAVQVYKNVELGRFKFNINIPDNVLVYTYSRKEVMNEANKIAEPTSRERFMEQHLLAVEGDSFIVPRSYMPLDDGTQMWGTGEYSIKVKIKESCQFNEKSDKAKNWKKDYKRLRKMKNQSGEFEEYIETLWRQYGNNLVKVSYKTAISTASKDLINTSSGNAASKTGASSSAGAPKQ